MVLNYPANYYIQCQLKDFNQEFVDCVIRCFNMIDHNEEPDGCLSNSVALYVCAKEYGYDPVLCYGLCSYEQKLFYHAWLEIDGMVIDPSIYGNVNYGFSFRLLGVSKMLYPYVGFYDDSYKDGISYGKFLFDDDWSKSLLYAMEGKTFEQYMDGLPQHAMWKVACLYLNKPFTKNYMFHLKKLIKGKRIEKNFDKLQFA